MSRISGNVYVDGNFSSKSRAYPAGSITNVAWSQNDGDELATSKQVHRVSKSYGQDSGAAAITKTKLIHTAQYSGNVSGLTISVSTAPTSSDTATFDLQKSTAGGVFATVLTGTVAFSSSDSDRSGKTGTISGTGAYVADDIFQAVVVIAGTTTDGFDVSAVFDEQPN